MISLYDIRDLLFKLLEKEGAKQEIITFVASLNNEIHIFDSNEQEWIISVKPKEQSHN